jgi:hypothetical protein
MPKSKFPRLFIERHEKGLVCGREVFNQYLDHVSEDNVDEWMLELTPELLARFQNSVQDFNRSLADYPLATEAHIAKWRHAASLMRGWFRLMRGWFQRRTLEPGASPSAAQRRGLAIRKSRKGHNR